MRRQSEQENVNGRIIHEISTCGDLMPEGYGIIEIEGLNVELIDSDVYTYEAWYW